MLDNINPQPFQSVVQWHNTPAESAAPPASDTALPAAVWPPPQGHPLPQSKHSMNSGMLWLVNDWFMVSQ